MFGRLTPMVKNLIILNVTFYICTVFIAPQLYDLFSLWFIKNPNFKVWQPITYMFMHSSRDLSHLLFNMFMLFLFGSWLEEWMGGKKFLFFYLASGIGSFVTVGLTNYFEYFFAFRDLIDAGYTDDQILMVSNLSKFWTPTVGASGSIYGVMAGIMYLYRDVPITLLFIPIPIKAKYLIGFYMLKEVLATLQIMFVTPGVAHLAHVGGAIFGFIMIWYWKKNDQNKYRID